VEKPAEKTTYYRKFFVFLDADFDGGGSRPVRQGIVVEIDFL
jgi:hypothetical protein